MDSRYAYLFFEFSLFFTILFLTTGWERLGTLFTAPNIYKVIGLCVFFLVVDHTAVRIGIWHFPITGSVPIRLMGLPVEEYILAPLHCAVTFLLVELFSESPDHE